MGDTTTRGARLVICYDPHGRLEAGRTEELAVLGIREARLDIAGGLDGRDIYQVARRLAELLLEQL